jgi:hypothetical protein
MVSGDFGGSLDGRSSDDLLNCLRWDQAGPFRGTDGLAPALRDMGSDPGVSDGIRAIRALLLGELP